MEFQLKDGRGSHKGSGTGVENYKDSYFISSLLWISFSLDGLSLISHLQGGIWKSYSSLIYNVTVLFTQRLCSRFPRENLIGRVSVRCPFLSQWAIALGRGWRWEVGLWGCLEHFPVDCIGMWGRAGRQGVGVLCVGGGLSSKGACGTDGYLKGICSCRGEPVLENVMYYLSFMKQQNLSLLFYKTAIGDKTLNVMSLLSLIPP